MAELVAPRAIGLDVGSVSLKGVALDLTGEVVARLALPAAGGLAAQAQRLIGALAGGAPLVSLCVTGAGKALFEGLKAARIQNDLVATASAAAKLHPDARAIIEIGGHQAKWVRLGEGGRIDSFQLNDQCAAGAGAFLEQQAGRLRMGIGYFSELAAGAPKGASVAGRCSVFAKSDMIHLQQKGTPPGEIAYGLCLALARNFRATLLRGGEMVKPALLAGGGARNRGLHRAFIEVCGVEPEELPAADHPEFLAAYGAALAARGAEPLSPAEIQAFLALAEVQQRRTGSQLQPLRASESATRPEPEGPPPGKITAFLGVDVGSVSTDFCLVSPGGDLLLGVYLATRGDPIGVMAEGLAILGDRAGDRLEILGVGTTGSGRHLAGRLLGADVVKNEITCQVLGARHVLPDVDTILEIGGQDSKFVSVDSGHIADFVMNKICAAGTGSFLEEQAEGLGVRIVGEFTDLALEASVPCDLGSQCTVFMETEVVAARQRGASLPEVCAGLACSVARNYLEKVVAGRPIGQNVVFQGGVASNGAVVAAFEQLLGKPVTVHPYNRLSGAIGAALAAQREWIEGVASRFRGLDAVKDVAVKSFECRVCSNVCQVAKISWSGDSAYFGDVCERFTSRDGEGSASGVPDLFGEREELFESFAGGEAERGVVGIPRASTMFEYFPFWASFFRHLGYRVVLSPPTTARILEEGVRRLTAETCLPIKVAYGHVAALLKQDVDFVFLPSVSRLPDDLDQPSHSCPFVESAGFMVAGFAGDRVVVPSISLAGSAETLAQDLHEALARLGVTLDQTNAALIAAQEGFADFRARLLERGQEVLASDFGLAFAVLGKPYNCHDPFLNLGLAKHIRRLGVLPIPGDMLPADPAHLEARGVTLPWRYNRDILRSLLAVSRDDRLFPVVVSNFGCGPDAFGLKYLEQVAGRSPYLLLEFDEHRGEAGLVTRLEAFLDEVSHFGGGYRAKQVSLRRPRILSLNRRLKGHRVVLPYFADHAWAYLGALRYAGYDAHLLPPPDEASLAAGEEASSGKECHPYIVLLGDLVKHKRLGNIRAGDVYFFVGTSNPCLLHEYGKGMQIALDRLGVGGIDVVSPDTDDHWEILGYQALVRLWQGLVATDLLIRARCQIRPYAADPSAVDSVLDQVYPDLAATLAEDRLGEALTRAGRALEGIRRNASERRPVVGIAGDIYTRIHPFGNQGLFDHLERLGLEVWPAPFLVDSIDFWTRKAISDGLYGGQYLESAVAAMGLMRQELESWRVRFHLGTRIDRVDEPGYRETLELARPYLDGRANDVLVQNVAKMVDFANRGADGIINAISFHCMLGTVSAALAERIRQDVGALPLITLVYSGSGGGEIASKLEAFAHQVKTHAAARKADRGPLAGARQMMQELAQRVAPAGELLSTMAAGTGNWLKKREPGEP
ncbi:MAG: hypothetical protein FJZ01_14340 [Candidatus Sericytochromatia bacterium]|nr:hypothetical protein [Candidatus Tanganyikabacteria bacterium]